MISSNSELIASQPKAYDKRTRSLLRAYDEPVTAIGTIVGAYLELDIRDVEPSQVS